jgi:hypothetical protein
MFFSRRSTASADSRTRAVLTHAGLNYVRQTNVDMIRIGVPRITKRDSAVLKLHLPDSHSARLLPRIDTPRSCRFANLDVAAEIRRWYARFRFRWRLCDVDVIVIPITTGPIPNINWCLSICSLAFSFPVDFL